MPRLDNPIFAVALIALGMALVPLNDAGIALLDQGNAEDGVAPMPILQIITGRAALGLAVLAFIPGAIAGVLALSPWTWVKLMARGGILVGSMLTYFLGLTIFQLWEMSAIFFVCPVIISLLSVPLLGERLGFGGLWRSDWLRRCYRYFAAKNERGINGHYMGTSIPARLSLILRHVPNCDANDAGRSGRACDVRGSDYRVFWVWFGLRPYPLGRAMTYQEGPKRLSIP